MVAIDLSCIMVIEVQNENERDKEGMLMPELTFDGVANSDTLPDGTTVYFDASGKPRQRTGMSATSKLAKEICGLMGSVSPIIRSIWKDVPAVILMVDVLTAVCAWASQGASGVASGLAADEAFIGTQDVVADLRAALDKYDAAVGGV